MCVLLVHVRNERGGGCQVKVKKTSGKGEKRQCIPRDVFEDHGWFLPACQCSGFSRRSCSCLNQAEQRLSGRGGSFIFPHHKSLSLPQTVFPIVVVELKIRARDEGKQHKLRVLKVNFNKRALWGEMCFTVTELLGFQLANNNEGFKVTMQNLKSRTGL